MRVVACFLSLLCVCVAEESCSYQLPDDFKTACGLLNLKVTSASGHTLVDDSNCDQLFSKAEFSTKPEIKYTAANTGKQYSLVMVDPDAPNHKEGQYWLHWIIANIKGSDLKDGNISSGDQVIGYHPPGPPKGTGEHRYIFLLFEQHHTNIQLTKPETRPRFPLAKWISEQEGLFCHLVAGIQFRVQFEE
uniref:Phosphatidylethanolamine-binding protein n=2 Tax=Timema TaxID=61471 RepID=A0A7R9JNW0_TIMGE|nr:unnamed protein product [Timema genevievae]